MSQDKVDVVRTGFDAWSRADVEAFFDLLDPEIEWTVRDDLPEAGVYRGRDGVTQLLVRFAEVLEDQWVEPQEFIQVDPDVVVVPIHWGGRGRLSGAEVAEREGETWVFTVRDGKVARVMEYRHKAEALEAVGLAGSG